MKNKFTRKTDHKKKKNKEFEKKRRIKDIFVIFPKTKRQFFQRPKKKIDKRKSRKVISRNATNQKNMEHTRQQHDARRKKTRDLPQIKAGFQKDIHKFVKNAYFLAKKKNRDEENW